MIYSKRKNPDISSNDLSETIKLFINFCRFKIKLKLGGDIDECNSELYKLSKKDFLLPFENWIMSPETKQYFLIEDRRKEIPLKIASEEDLFDLIEFLYIKYFKDNDNLFNEFQKNPDLSDNHYKSSRDEINEILKDFENGYEISPDGEIYALADESLESVLIEQRNFTDKDTQRAKKIDLAILKFRNKEHDLEEQKIAILTIVNELELVRESLKNLIGNDAQEIFEVLFNFANRFGVSVNLPFPTTINSLLV